MSTLEMWEEAMTLAKKKTDYEQSITELQTAVLELLATQKQMQVQIANLQRRLAYKVDITFPDGRKQ